MAPSPSLPRVRNKASYLQQAKNRQTPRELFVQTHHRRKNTSRALRTWTLPQEGKKQEPAQQDLTLGQPGTFGFSCDPFLSFVKRLDLEGGSARLTGLLAREFVPAAFVLPNPAKTYSRRSGRRFLAFCLAPHSLFVTGSTSNVGCQTRASARATIQDDLLLVIRFREPVRPRKDVCRVRSVSECRACRGSDLVCTRQQRFRTYLGPWPETLQTRSVASERLSGCDLRRNLPLRVRLQRWIDETVVSETDTG